MSSPFKRGDFFCTVNPSASLGKSITLVQKYRTVGIPSKSNHSGWFLDEDTVFESMWQIQQSNVWKAHEGRDFLVGRWTGMTDEKFDRAWEFMQQFEGKYYPIPRLFMYLLTPIWVQLIAPTSVISFGLFSSMVCSELAGRAMSHAGFEVFKGWRGMMPAHIANIIRRDKDVEIVYEKAPLRRLE